MNKDERPSATEEKIEEKIEGDLIISSLAPLAEIGQKSSGLRIDVTQKQVNTWN